MASFADAMTLALQVFLASLWAVLWSGIPYGVAPPMWMRPAQPKQTVTPAVVSSVPPVAAGLSNITSLSLVFSSPDNELIHHFTDFGTAELPKAPSPLLIGLVFCLFLASLRTRSKAEKAWPRFKFGQRKARTNTATASTTTTSSGTQTEVSMMPASLKYVVTASTAPAFVFGGAAAADRDEMAKLRTSLATALTRITALEEQTREIAQLRIWNHNARLRIDELMAEARLPPPNPYAANYSGQTSDLVWQVGQPRVNYGNNSWFPEPINRSEMEIWLSLHPRQGGINRGGINRGGINRGGINRGGINRGGINRGG